MSGAPSVSCAPRKKIVLPIIVGPPFTYEVLLTYKDQTIALVLYPPTHLYAYPYHTQLFYCDLYR